eukprot:6885544-Pyramimonas_sp.AAC.1
MARGGRDKRDGSWSRAQEISARRAWGLEHDSMSEEARASFQRLHGRAPQLNLFGDQAADGGKTDAGVDLPEAVRRRPAMYDIGDDVWPIDLEGFKNSLAAAAAEVAATLGGWHCPSCPVLPGTAALSDDHRLQRSSAADAIEGTGGLPRSPP